MRLLVVEDDVQLARAVARFLTRHHYVVDVVADGQSAWESLQSVVYDLVLLDVMLPRLDGISLCQKLRQQKYSMPILLLTACSSSSDRVLGLDAGADDYVIKPFDWKELLARVRALLRRESTLTSSILTWGALSLDSKNCQVHYAGKELALRPREYQLLELFLRNPNQVFSCGAILDKLWSLEGEFPSEDAVRAHIKGLRQKLRLVEANDMIETVYGLGYRLKPTDPSLITGELTESTSAVKPEVANELQQAIAEVWQDVKLELLKRVEFLEQTAHSINAGVVEPQQQQQAIAETHKLAGTVGSYGFKQGSHLARQIETLLKADPPLSQTQIAALEKHITALRQELLTDPQLTLSTSSGILSQIQSLRSVDIGSARILAIDDNPETLSMLATVLGSAGIHLTTLQDSRQFWEYLENTTPDLLLLDVMMPYVNGAELCQRVRLNPRWAALPIVFLTAYTDTNTVQRAFGVGADDFVSKPIEGPKLLARLVGRLERYRFYQRLTEQDGLTQVANRTKFTRKFAQLLQTVEHQSTEHQCVYLIILRIDQLKSVNYQYGYEIGDDLLRQVGLLLNRINQPDNIVARWSGNKFAIALHQSEPTAEQELANLLQNLSQKPFFVTPAIQLTLSASAGTAQYPKDGKDIQTLYRIAELSLEQT